MDIVRTTVRKEGSCNFCNRGELIDFYPLLKYPYEHVTTLTRSSNNGVKVTICDDCLKELNEKLNSAD